MAKKDFDLNAISNDLVDAWRYAKTYPYRLGSGDGSLIRFRNQGTGIFKADQGTAL